jgi:ectoine hydroxylase-related dioxygenase (phytanoyl-CoA dioxygenase family)
MAWIDSIEQNGFSIMPALFSSDYVDHLSEDIDRLSPRRSRAGIRHALQLDPVKDLAAEPLLTEIACGVLGSACFPFRATLFDKSSRSNWLVVWHQDTALPLHDRSEVSSWGPWSIKEEIHYAHAPAGTLSQVLALRIHLDDSTAENGPLRVLPRTHNLGVLSDDGLHDIAARITPVDCVVGKGGVIAMRPLLVHASSKSRVDRPRRVLHIEYAAADAIAAPLRLKIT